MTVRTRARRRRTRSVARLRAMRKSHVRNLPIFEGRWDEHLERYFAPMATTEAIRDFLAGSRTA